MEWGKMGFHGGGVNKLTDSIDPLYNVVAITTYHNKLYAGGIFSSLGNVHAYSIGVWNGSTWAPVSVQPFQNDADNGVAAFTVYNNKLYMVGTFDTIAGQPDVIGIACWNDTNWSSLNFPSFRYYYSIWSICEYQGSIYAAGEFSYAASNDTVNNILRWDGKNWHSVGGGINNAWINSMVVYNGELYAAGYFSKSDGNIGNNIQKWDGTKWSDVGGGTDYEIFNLMVYHGKLYAMGEISSAGGIYTSNIAVWDTNKWCSLGSTFDNTIFSSCVYKDSLYIGGGWWTIDGDSISYIAEWTGGDYLANCGQPQGVNEVKDESAEVKVYPNPSGGVFNLQISPDSYRDYQLRINTNIEVYNMLGEKVYSQFNIQNPTFNIDLSNQNNGVYLYRVTATDGSLMGQGKLVIEK